MACGGCGSAASLAKAALQSVGHQLAQVASGEQTASQAARKIASGSVKVARIAWKGLVPNPPEEQQRRLAICKRCSHAGAVFCKLCEACQIVEKSKWADAEYPDIKDEQGVFLCGQRHLTPPPPS